ncbi:hypothetical protein UVI_02056920 [Ustilaginoidea virens]|uniref:Uncharacterized protein n=1 Tax=Ustilaginoidea virens TaxID=1159556 RepID=A0A1B5KWQ4_USTVR|nr:hypothetical protein UVI_02056920 [Ustilaginoidea virens]
MADMASPSRRLRDAPGGHRLERLGIGAAFKIAVLPLRRISTSPGRGGPFTYSGTFLQARARVGNSLRSPYSGITSRLGQQQQPSKPGRVLRLARSTE